MKILVLITTILTFGFAYTGEGVSELVTLDTVDPTVQVLAPNGGEIYVNEEFIEITWSASDFSFGDTPIKIYFSFDGGETYTDSTGFEENDGIYQWTVPESLCLDAVVRITAIDEFGNSTEDESDNTFSYCDDGPQISIPPSSFSFDINFNPFAGKKERGIQLRSWIDEIDKLKFMKYFRKIIETRKKHCVTPADQSLSSEIRAGE